MSLFFEYLIKSSISLAVLFGLYKLTMSSEKIFIVNRFLLLAILICSMVLPFLNFSFIRKVPAIQKIEVARDFIFYPSVETISERVTITPEPAATASQINVTGLIYWLIIGILIFRLIISLARVLQLIRHSEKRAYETYLLSIVKELIQPFTFFRKIVLSENDFKTNKIEIITHEQEHIRQLHTIDLVMCELYTLIYWFNPFAWLLRRELRLVHEFQADQAVLKKGIDVTKYQLLVLKKAVGERRFAMANNFTQCPISKRFKMMNKYNRNRWAPIKLLLFVPLGLMLLLAFSKPEFITDLSPKIVPVLNLQDSTQIWLDKWQKSIVSKLRDNTGLQQPETLKICRVVTVVEPNNPVFKLGEIQMNKANVFIVLQNKNGQLLVENKPLKQEELKEALKSFLKGTNMLTKNSDPEAVEIEIPLIGKATVSKGIISYQSDVHTPSEFVGAIIRTLGEAYLEVREETAQAKFGQAYFSLNKEKRDVIDQLIPCRISFREPKQVGTRKSTVN